MKTLRFFLAGAAIVMVFNSNLVANERGIANKDTKFTMTVTGGLVVRNLPAGTDLEVVGKKVPGVLMIRIGQDNGTIPKDDVTLAPAPVAPQKKLSNPTPSASVRAHPPSVDKDLPWEKDFSTALAKAKKEKRPIFLLQSYDLGLAYHLPLRDPSIRSALDDFVWVFVSPGDQACKDFMTRNKSISSCLFIDSEAETIIAKTTGDAMMKDISVARAAAALPLTPEMQKSLLTAFEPDSAIIREMSNAGDVAGLLAYLKPLESDTLRKNDFLVLQVHLPPGIPSTDAVCMIAEKSETVSSDGSFSESGFGPAKWPISNFGVCAVSIRPMSGDIVETIRISAPGCEELQAEVRLNHSTAVLSREYTLLPLPPEKAASFEGHVLWADGKPAADAIVRICDWKAVTRTDAAGHFQIASVSPGKFLVRAETPGGEFHSDCNFEAGVILTKDLILNAVTTIGIRWVLQTKEGSLKFSGDGLRSGEAYFSVPHSKFSFIRGSEAGGGAGYERDLFISKFVEEHIQNATGSAQNAMRNLKLGTPIFFLSEKTAQQMRFSSGPNTRKYRPGLHSEHARFDDVTEVNGGKPLSEGTDFENLNGVPIRAGDVYTLRCLNRDCYVKMEITDVTLVDKNP